MRLICLLPVLLCSVLTVGLSSVPVTAQATKEKSLPLNGAWNDDGTVLTLDWQDAEPLRVGPVDINRRRYGETGGASWAPLTQNLQRRYFFEDPTPKIGMAYEYQVIRKARDIVDVGYWLAGSEVPAVETRGRALLVIDETIAEPLAARLDRFERDLIGDGWRVVKHSAPRHDGKDAVANLANARALRSWITQTVEDARGTPHSLILVGHVPVVFSGRVAPDGHEHVPHETDLFYADIGRRWADAEPGRLRPSTLPDLQIDMTVGRIDFGPLSDRNRDAELRLVAAYFDKNHHWRHGRLGDLRNAYGQNGNLTVEMNALRNIVGAEAITAGGHHNVGISEPHLWGVDFGHWKGRDYPGQGIKPVFAINFGSGKQKFIHRFNPMNALLAQDWYPLAVGWGGRPAWMLHLMALGGTVGEMHMRTVNNGPFSGGPYRQVLDYYPMGNYLWRGPIWVNLMGDPTLHAFPLLPPEALTATRDEDGTRLTWDAPDSPDVQGYKVYRAQDWSEPFAPISEVQSETAFHDPDGAETDVYMVRSYGLKTVNAGSFYTYSQGVFARAGMAAPALLTESLATPIATPVTLPDHEGLSYIEGPRVGRLEKIEVADAGMEKSEDTATPAAKRIAWVYTPPADFAGMVAIRNAISTQWGTTEGVTTITVGDGG